MPRQCATSSCPNLTDSGICKQCSVEQNWGDPGDYNPDGTRADGDFEKAELREGETRDDDNTHARRNAEQMRIAERELEEQEGTVKCD